MTQRLKRTLCRFIVLLPLVGTVAGCSATPESGESVGDVQEAVLGNSSWTPVKNFVFPEGATSPTIVNKRLDASTDLQWVLARNNNGDGIYLSKRQNGGAFSSWTLMGTAVASAPAVVSWAGDSGSSTRNALVAYVDTGNNARVAESPKTNTTGFGAFSTLSSANAQTFRPALAWANNRVFLFVVGPGGVVRFRYANTNANGIVSGSWNPNWINLSNAQVISGGLAAAATGTDTITVVGTPTGCAAACTAVRTTVTASTAAPAGSWSTLPGAFLLGGSSPSMTANGPGDGSNGARILAKLSDNKLWSATSGTNYSDWNNLNDTGCSAPSDGGGWAQEELLSGKIFVSNCSVPNPTWSRLP